MKPTPSPAMTKCFIISLDSISIEILRSSSTKSKYSLIRLRVRPPLGSNKGCWAISSGATDFAFASE